MHIHKGKLLSVVLGGTLIGLSSIAVAQTSADEEMLATAGEFEVGNGETHLIANHKTDELYRICVAKSRGSVPLKVMFDGKEETIASGCSDVEAMKIKVTPAGKLGENMVLIGKFHRLHR